nr:lysoplasmalogenase [Auraticoccus cholistanensis]
MPTPPAPRPASTSRHPTCRNRPWQEALRSPDFGSQTSSGLAETRRWGHTGAVPTAATPAPRRWPAALFVLVGAVHLVALLLGWPTSTYTQWLLVPPLIAHLLLRCRTVRSPLVRWGVVALLLSWLGDSVPTLLPPPARLPTNMVFFGLAHASWIMAFLPCWRRSIVGTRPQLLVPYAIGVVGLIGLCLPGSGSLWPAVVAYGLLLVTMPVLATGVDVLTSWGGIAFVLCAGLLGWRAFRPGFDLPAVDAVIMAAYLCAQALLVAGTLRAQWRRGPGPALGQAPVGLTGRPSSA